MQTPPNSPPQNTRRNPLRIPPRTPERLDPQITAISESYLMEYPEIRDLFRELAVIKAKSPDNVVEGSNIQHKIRKKKLEISNAAKYFDRKKREEEKRIDRERKERESREREKILRVRKEKNMILKRRNNHVGNEKCYQKWDVPWHFLYIPVYNHDAKLILDKWTGVKIDEENVYLSEIGNFRENGVQWCESCRQEAIRLIEEAMVNGSDKRHWCDPRRLFCSGDNFKMQEQLIGKKTIEVRNRTGTGGKKTRKRRRRIMRKRKRKKKTKRNCKKIANKTFSKCWKKRAKKKFKKCWNVSRRKYQKCIRRTRRRK
tara:strand:+ start:2256 stop:3200 length:945 start_codon:yes stop_codon:yes gene_type:complete